MRRGGKVHRVAIERRRLSGRGGIAHELGQQRIELAHRRGKTSSRVEAGVGEKRVGKLQRRVRMRRVELADAVAVRRQYPASPAASGIWRFPVAAQRQAVAVLADKEKPDGEARQGECATARGNLPCGGKPAGRLGGMSAGMWVRRSC